MERETERESQRERKRESRRDRKERETEAFTKTGTRGEGETAGFREKPKKRETPRPRKA